MLETWKLPNSVDCQLQPRATATSISAQQRFVHLAFAMVHHYFQCLDMSYNTSFKAAPSGVADLCDFGTIL